MGALQIEDRSDPYAGRMEFLKIKLLYKIDLIRLGGHRRYCFEMAVKVTLVKKTAFQGNL